MAFEISTNITVDITSIATLIGMVGGTLGIISFYRDYFGKLKVIISFQRGRYEHPNKNQIVRYSEIVVKVSKFGRLKQSISSASVETRPIVLSDGNTKDINTHINISGLIGISFDLNELQVTKIEFPVDGALGRLLLMLEIRVKLTDTRDKVYYSQWIRYSDYLNTLNRTNLPLSEINTE